MMKVVFENRLFSKLQVHIQSDAILFHKCTFWVNYPFKEVNGVNSDLMLTKENKPTEVFKHQSLIRQVL